MMKFNEFSESWRIQAMKDERRTKWYNYFFYNFLLILFRDLSVFLFLSIFKKGHKVRAIIFFYYWDI